MKRDMRRLSTVALTLAMHVLVLMLWRHQTAASGVGAADAGVEKSIEVRIVAAASAAAGSAPLVARARADSAAQPQSGGQLQGGVALAKVAYQPPLYYGPQEVDKGALPYSAPDPDLLAGVAASGVPIRVRLYIDASGKVTAVEKLQALADDLQALERIEAMLRSTSFMPARLAGADVNSYQDLEFHIDPELNGAPG
ncbi:MAG: hypothetical protein JWQ61_3910 [Collimonas fungivorans]|uniref:hypothetical protein n=1 Tax=Collimonas fungivorans TaxID=158899 RepID=UPI0026F121B9|nr:hypothetical protein [Collimonas fungivorans]MDB5769096.1 hypothetical protein [Collimonas fungivorans]